MLEALAVQSGVEAFASLINNAPLLVVVDNTSVQYCMHKGYAREFELNDAILRALQTCGRSASLRSVRIARISSEENPSDGWSRLGSESLPHLVAGFPPLLGPVGRRLSGTALRVCVPRRRVPPG